MNALTEASRNLTNFIEASRTIHHVRSHGRKGGPALGSLRSAGPEKSPPFRQSPDRFRSRADLSLADGAPTILRGGRDIELNESRAAPYLLGHSPFAVTQYLPFLRATHSQARPHRSRSEMTALTVRSDSPNQLTISWRRASLPDRTMKVCTCRQRSPHSSSSLIDIGVAGRLILLVMMIDMFMDLICPFFHYHIPLCPPAFVFRASRGHGCVNERRYG